MDDLVVRQQFVEHCLHTRSSTLTNTKLVCRTAILATATPIRRQRSNV